MPSGSGSFAQAASIAAMQTSVAGNAIDRMRQRYSSIVAEI